jgi:Rieske Fe-S protein
MSKQEKLSRRLFTSKLVGATLVLPLVEACSSSSDTPQPTNDPKVTLTSPKAGESFAAGSTLIIRWTAENINTLKLDFSQNSGNTWQTLSGNVAAATGRYDWVLPNVVSPNYKVRLLNPTNQVVLAESGEFKIVAQGSPTANFVSPKSGDSLVANQVFKVEWTSQNVQNLDLLFASNGTNFETIASNIPSSQTSLDWTVPVADTSTSRLRLIDSASKAVLANSSNFSIVSKAAQITSPAAGQTLSPGKPFDITWVSSNIANLKIELSSDGGSNWIILADSLPAASGKFTWDVPANLDGNSFKIRLIDKLDSKVLFTSANFSIKANNPTASFTSQPAEADVLAGNEKILLKWTASGFTNLKIQFSSNNGSSWANLTTLAASLGEYNWTVNNLNSTQCKLRLLNAENDNLLATSNTFRIRESKEVDLNTHTELNTVGNLKVFNGFFGTINISVQRTATDTFLVHRMICTHASCPVEWQNTNNRYFCNCHGSVFAKNGNVNNGPATSPLPTYQHKYKSSESKLFIFQT